MDHSLAEDSILVVPAMEDSLEKHPEVVEEDSMLGEEDFGDILEKQEEAVEENNTPEKVG